jgi:hypothetical protein
LAADELRRAWMAVSSEACLRLIIVRDTLQQWRIIATYYCVFQV